MEICIKPLLCAERMISSLNVMGQGELGIQAY